MRVGIIELLRVKGSIVQMFAIDNTQRESDYWEDQDDEDENHTYFAEKTVRASNETHKHHF